MSLLASQNKEEREFAVGQILKIRGESDLGDMGCRDRVTPFLNMDATTLIELIDQEKDTVHEPVFSCNLPQADIKQIIENPMEIPYHPLHTQSTERAVKQVRPILPN